MKKMIAAVVMGGAMAFCTIGCGPAATTGNGVSVTKDKDKTDIKVKDKDKPEVTVDKDKVEVKPKADKDKEPSSGLLSEREQGRPRLCGRPCSFCHARRAPRI